MQAVGGAGEQAGVGFKNLGAAEHARGLRADGDGRQGGRRGAVEHEATVGLAAEIYAGAVGEADPGGVVLNAGGRGGEEVTPIAGVGLGEERTGFAVGAGRDEPVGRAETIANGGESAAVGVGAGFHPEHGGGAGGEVEQDGAGLGREFVEHVADDEGEGRGGEAEAGRVEQRERGEIPAGAGGGEGNCLGGVIVEMEAGKVRGTEGGEHATAGDAAAAAPVHQHGAGGRSPGADGEFAEKIVPFPADALGVGGVVGGERVVGLPIRGGAGGGVAKERGAEAVERGPVEVVKIGHGFRKGRRVGRVQSGRGKARAMAFTVKRQPEFEDWPATDAERRVVR